MTIGARVDKFSREKYRRWGGVCGRVSFAGKAAGAGR